MGQMRLEKCARCNKIFASLHAVVCPACQPAEDADYEKVLKVLRRQPGMSTEQVAEEAEVQAAVVLRLLDEGRVENTQFGDAIPCGRCGAPAISVTKRLCQTCLVKLDMECAGVLRELREIMVIRNKTGVHEVHQTLEGKRRMPAEDRGISERARTAKEERRRMAIRERQEGTGTAQNKARTPSKKGRR